MYFDHVDHDLRKRAVCPPGASECYTAALYFVKSMPSQTFACLCRPGEDQNAGGEDGCEIDNLAQDALLFESCGIGIGSHEATCLAVGLRKLAQAEPVCSF